MASPPWKHQHACVTLAGALWLWSLEQGGGMVLTHAVIATATPPIPLDIIWIRTERLATVLSHQTMWPNDAPDLVVDICTPDDSPESFHRVLAWCQDAGVRECWAVNPWEATIDCYHRINDTLELVKVCADQDILLSPLLNGFACPVAAILPQQT